MLTGCVMMLGGLGHWVGVALRASAGALEHPIPYLVLVGLVQVAAGALLVVAARAHGAGEGSARPVAALGAFVIAVYAAAVLPALGDDPLPFQIAPVVYTVASVTLAASLLAGVGGASRGARAGARTSRTSPAPARGPEGAGPRSR